MILWNLELADAEEFGVDLSCLPGFVDGFFLFFRLSMISSCVSDFLDLPGESAGLFVESAGLFVESLNRGWGPPIGFSSSSFFSSFF